MCDQIARIAIISTCQKMIEWVKLVETDRLIMKQFFSFQKSTDIKHELFMVLSLGAGVRLRREKERETERRKESERVCYSSPGGTVSPPLQHEQPAPCGPQTHTHTHSSCRRWWWQTFIWCFISWHKRHLPSRVHTPSCSSEDPEHRCPFTSAYRNVMRASSTYEWKSYSGNLNLTSNLLWHVLTHLLYIYRHLMYVCMVLLCKNTCYNVQNLLIVISDT